MRVDRGSVRSLYFLHIAGRGSGGLEKRLRKALKLIGDEHSTALYRAHVLHEEPFPRREEEEAADALLRAFEILTPPTPPRKGTPAGVGVVEGSEALSTPEIGVAA